MSVEVVMPQMGESITEGTVSKWLKQVGERVEKDEPILEISTDKVDAEVPSPGAGVLLAINTQEGETVEVGTIVAVIGDEGEAPAVSNQQSAVSSQPEPSKTEPVAEPEQTEPKIAAEVAATLTETPQSALRNPQSSEATEVVMPQMGESITEGT